VLQHLALAFCQRGTSCSFQGCGQRSFKASG
jgi:hypothetical protein